MQKLISKSVIRSLRTVNSKSFSFFLKNDLKSDFIPKHVFLKVDNRPLSNLKQNILNPLNNLDQALINFKISRLIKGAIKEYGPILEKNIKLASVLKKADELNVPMDFIDFARKIAVDCRAKSGIYEMLYLNHGFFIVQYEDVDSSNTRHHLLKICDKYDIHLISGKVRWDDYFYAKAILSVHGTELKPIGNEKEAEKIALQIGAQSVSEDIDLDGWKSWQFYCKPEELHKVKRQLQENSLEIDEAYVGFIPKRKIPLPAHVKRSAYSIISHLSELSAVDNLYTNILI